MKYLFTILLGVHGLLHLIGYTKAFFESDISKQAVGVSKPIGSIWLVTFVMFMAVVILFLTEKKWFYLALIAVLVSQILIVATWQDAKFGTIVNIVILLVSLSSLATYRFHKMVENESQQILQNINDEHLHNIVQTEITDLPEIIQKWIINSGAIGNPKIQTVHLKQVGTLRTKPNSNWMPFEATQVFNVDNPAFVWQTKVTAMPLIDMVGRDQLKDGKGKMLIKLAGLIPVVNTSDNHKINSGAMLRYLAEICWFPSAALNDYIRWEAIDSNSAKATFWYNGQSVSGVFSFNDKGDFTAFEADRYYGGSENSQLEKWVITTESYKIFNNIKIPSRCKVTWKLKEGDFNWLKLEITDIKYNVSKDFAD